MPPARAEIDLDLAMIATHVAPATGYGGVPASAARLIGAWARDDRRIALVASDASHDGRLAAGRVTAAPGVEVHLYRARLFPRWGFGLGAIPAIWRACRRARAVYVNGVATWPTTLGALIAGWLGKPLVIATRGGLMAAHIRAIRREKPWKWVFYRLLTMPSLRRAGAVHVTSALERDDLLALLPGLRRVAVVANGIDLEDFSARPPARHDGLRLIYAGRVAREKGIVGFLDTWLRVRAPGDRFTLAGDGEAGAYRARFEALVARADGAIEAMGYLAPEALKAAIGEADFLVLPSGLEADDVRENFGNAVAEAFALGRPVLVTRGLAWDRVEALGTGLTFEADPASVAATIERARTIDGAEYARMCLAARGYAEAELDLSLTAEALWRIIDETSG